MISSKLTMVDKSGIDGRYDVHLDLTRLAAGKKSEDAAGAGGDRLLEAPSTMFNDALRPYGLELRSRKLLVDVIVIDQVKSDPVPN